MQGLNGKALAEYKQRLVLQPDQQHVLLGMILGDGCLRFPGRSHHANLTVEHGEAQQDYVWYKYECLRDWVTTPPKRVTRVYHKDVTRTTVSWRFGTISHPTLTSYHSLFYAKGTKMVPECICDLITHPLTLAIWLMDDGNRNKDVLFISTECFSVADQQRLCQCLLGRFGIDSTLNSHSQSRGRRLYRIRLTRQGSKRMVHLIQPYVVPSLAYKFSAVPL